MPLYIAELVGAGTEDDGRRLPIVAPGCGAIFLDALGIAICWLPQPVTDIRLTQLADMVDERLALTSKTRIESRLGVVLPRRDLAKLAIADLLTSLADGVRWGGLRPSVERGRKEIWLGELGCIWSEAVAIAKNSQAFTESWPTNSTTLSTGQDHPWTETQNDMEVVAGVIQNVAGMNAGRARCDDALDTDNHFHRASWSISVRNATTRGCYVHARESNAAQTYYYSRLRRDSDAGQDLRELGRIVAGTTTVLLSDTTDPGASGTIEVRCDGSTITMFLNGAQLFQTTDTNITGTLRVGLTIGNFSATKNEVTLDAHVFEDIVAAGQPAMRRQARIPAGAAGVRVY